MVTMTEAVTTTPDRPKRRNSAAKRDKVRMVADDVVTPNSLATHLGCTRQNIARLTAEAVIEQRSDGHYDQTASRLRYIKHLRDQHRRSPRTDADADHVRVKTEMLQLRLMEKKRELVKQEDVDELIDEIAGTVLTHLSGMAARCSRDMQVRRNIDAVVMQIRREISEACSEAADERNEPPLDEQD
jgi:hypothetical protein